MKPTDKIAVICGVSAVIEFSLTKVISILSVMGFEVCPIPSTMYSSKNLHESAEGEKVECDDYVEESRKVLKENGVNFKAILIGTLGSELAIDSAARFVNSFPSATVIIEPIFGDKGKYYKGVDLDYIEKMKQLISVADIIVPNFTEACFLSGEEYKGEATEWKILKICHNLEKIGASNIVISGIKSVNKKKVNVAIFTNTKLEILSFDKLRGSYPDTNKIFIAVLTGAVKNGHSLKESVIIASDFLRDCIKESNKHRYPNREGLIYENRLCTLLEK